jgi:regulatory protein
MEIRLDDASTFLLPNDEVLRLGLSSGDEIAAGRLHDIARVAGRAEAMRIAQHYLSVRPRSRRELLLQLRRKGMVDEAIDTVLARCEELGYLDDRAFAAAFARDRIRLRPCGVRRMLGDLREKGVAEADALGGIREAMAEEEVGERELLERVARARVSRLEGLDPQVAARRLFAFLSRRGFPADEVRRWIDGWCSRPDDTTDGMDGGQ